MFNMEFTSKNVLDIKDYQKLLAKIVWASGATFGSESMAQLYKTLMQLVLVVCGPYNSDELAYN